MFHSILNQQSDNENTSQNLPKNTNMPCSQKSPIQAKKCDGVSCNILGVVTVEWCTNCDYHDSGCGGIDY